MLLWLIGATRQLGFRGPGSALFLGETLSLAPHAHRHLHWGMLASYLGEEASGLHSRREQGAIRKWVLHSGAARSVREWPLDRYRSVVNSLSVSGHDVTVVCDAGQRTRWRQLGIDPVVPRSIEELMDLFRGVDAFIGNDSGPGHLAALMGLPTVTVFGPQLPSLFAPMHHESVWVEGGACDFKPCFDLCRFEEPHCILEVSVERVLETLGEFLGGPLEKVQEARPEPLPDEEGGGPETMGVMGTDLAVTDYESLTASCLEWAARDRTTVVEFCNTHVVTMRRWDDAFARTTSGTDWFVPDGMPLIWLMNRAGAGLGDRVYGPRFMAYFMEKAGHKVTHYLLGGLGDCLPKLKEQLRARNPFIRFAGECDGILNAQLEEEILMELDDLKPDVIWVGLGTPKQQDWIHRNRDRIGRGLILDVGFAFDVNAGLKPDAPAWMQRCGLTWLFRILSEPKRLLKRYLLNNSLFLWTLLTDLVRGRVMSGQGERPS